jgi:hypothetical protein
MGFLAMTFAVVGLTGVFVSYAAPLPLERVQQREAAFDEALAPNLTDAARADLRARLGEDAAPVLDGTGDLTQRVQAARVVARDRFRAEATAVGTRLRLLLVVVTCAAGLFGVALLNVASRAPHNPG